MKTTLDRGVAIFAALMLFVFMYDNQSPLLVEWFIWIGFGAIYLIVYIGSAMVHARVRRAKTKPTLVVPPLQPASRRYE